MIEEKSVSSMHQKEANDLVMYDSNMDLSFLENCPPLIEIDPTGFIFVKRRATIQLPGKSINFFLTIDSFPNPTAFLEKLLNGTAHTGYHIDPDYRQEVTAAVNDLYLDPPSARTGLTLQQRFALERGLLRKLQRPASTIIDTGPQAISQINLLKQQEEDANAFINDYKSAMCSVEKHVKENHSTEPLITIPPEGTLLNSDNEMIVWLLYYLVDHNIDIRRCPECGHLFAVDLNHRDYCSKECYDSYRALGRFCDDGDFEKAYRSIKRLLAERTNNDPNVKGFRYDKPTTPYQTVGYDDLVIFAGVIDTVSSQSDAVAKVYSYDEMWTIKKTVQKLREAKWEECKDAYRRYKRGDISEDERSSAKTAYISWCNDICLQLKAFKKVRK